jgi:transcription termination factor Rho
MRPAENQELKSQFIKSIEGAVQIKEGKSFGFVDRVYIPQNVIKHLKISNGDRIKGTAIKTYNKEKSEWGWKLMEASLCA